MFHVGIDDTDIIGSRGTNRLALQMIEELNESWCCHQLLRHQLLQDERVPFTSKNGSASLLFSPRENQTLDDLFDSLKQILLREFIEGSDPGLAVAEQVPESIVQFGSHCQSELQTQQTALGLAKESKVRLEGLGGTNDGVIGALAAIGLAATENDGRIIYLDGWPDQLEGEQSVETIRQRNVEVVCENAELETGIVTLNRKLRPNKQGGRNILFVKEGDDGYQAIKLP